MNKLIIFLLFILIVLLAIYFIDTERTLILYFSDKIEGAREYIINIFEERRELIEGEAMVCSYSYT